MGSLSGLVRAKHPAFLTGFAALLWLLGPGLQCLRGTGADKRKPGALRAFPNVRLFLCLLRGLP